MEHHLTLVLALVGLLGLGAQWLAWRLRLPAIVLLMPFGLAAGPGLGWIEPSADLGTLLDPIIKVGVAVILFEGGLRLRFHELRQAGQGVARLVTVGVLLSFPLYSVAAHYLGGFSWPVALVFGAIIVVTGPTVILPLLRQARLRRRPASYLKWEGIVNDPTGALLAVVIFEYLISAGDAPLVHMLPRVAIGLVLAGALGVGTGWVLGIVFRRGFMPEYLKGPAALTAAIAVYVIANMVLSEAGLLAATLLGVTLGNMSLPSIDEIRRFKEYVALVLVSGVFILMSADIDTAILLQLDWRSAALLVVLLFVARPLAVMAATLGTSMTWQERVLVAWIAPRGIVAAAMAGVFGTALLARGYPTAELLLPAVFVLIFVTVVLHGMSIGWLARRLGLSARTANGVLIVGASPWAQALATALKEMEVTVLLVDRTWRRLRAARLAGIPTYYGELLSEEAEQRLELGDYGYLVAATENDAYNTLVCTQFAAELGRNRVFQLPEPAGDDVDPKRLPRTVRGLILAADEARFDELMSNWYRGWSFQRTRLSDQFGYEEFLASRPADSLVVLLQRADGGIQVNSPEHPLKPKSGDLLLWFGPRAEKASAPATPAADENPQQSS
jgi:NhaP-type Na+/H+ or K+/H+ antiporter